MLHAPPLIARDWALFLDVDGTLLDYAPHPDRVVVPAPLRGLLEQIAHALDGSLALISGRTIADVDRLFAPLDLPVAGQHGAEIRCGGRSEILGGSVAALAAILAPVYAFAASHQGIRVEDKGLSAAIHYRGAEAKREQLAEILAAAVDRSGGGNFNLLPGHLVFDLKQRAIDKGSALLHFMSAPPFRARIPVFIGDEATDEDGFAAALSQGGLAIRVGSDGDTAAPYALPSPTALREWLARSAAKLAAKRSAF